MYKNLAAYITGATIIVAHICITKSKIPIMLQYATWLVKTKPKVPKCYKVPGLNPNSGYLPTTFTGYCSAPSLVYDAPGKSNNKENITFSPFSTRSDARSRRPFLITSFYPMKAVQIYSCPEKLNAHIFNFPIITVPAECQTSLCATTHASSVMTIFDWSIYTSPELDRLNDDFGAKSRCLTQW